MESEAFDVGIPSGVGTEGAPATSPSSPPVQPSGFPPAGAQPGPPAERQIPYDRFREVAEGQRRAREGEAAWRARHDDLERKLHAVMGLNQPAAADPAETEIRAAMERLYPGIGALLAQREQLQQLADVAPRFQQDMEQREQAQHDYTAQSTVQQLFTAAAATFGGQLTQGQKDQIHRSFYGHVATNPDIHARYLRSDPTLVPEFWQSYAAAMLDPARRTAAVALGARAQRIQGLPSAGPAGGPVGSGPPAPPEDTEDMLAAAFQSLRSRGGAR